MQDEVKKGDPKTRQRSEMLGDEVGVANKKYSSNKYNNSHKMGDNHQ